MASKILRQLIRTSKKYRAKPRMKRRWRARRKNKRKDKTKKERKRKDPLHHEITRKLGERELCTVTDHRRLTQPMYQGRVCGEPTFTDRRDLEGDPG